MSITPLDPAAVRAAAKAALDARLGLIDAIVAAQNQRTLAAGKVAEALAAERAAASIELAAIKAAIDGGWSAQELRASGLSVPQSVTKKGAGTSSAPSTKRNVRPARQRPVVPAAPNNRDQSPHRGEDSAAARQVPGDSYANAS